MPRGPHRSKTRPRHLDWLLKWIRHSCRRGAPSSRYRRPCATLPPPKPPLPPPPSPFVLVLLDQRAERIHPDLRSILLRDTPFLKQFGDGEHAQNQAAAMVMSDDDDDVEPHLTALENYCLLDAEGEPVSFSTLPLRLGNTGDVDVSQFKKRLVLWGTDDTGIKRYKEVVAWKLGLDARQPQIAVLAADGVWINLVKPKNSYEETVRTILITVQMLHFLRRKPDETDKNLWSHLRKVFDKFDVRPSVDDLRNYRSLIKQFAEKDPTLAKSETLQAFIDGVYRKNIYEVGADNIEVKKPFIADDEEVDDMVADGNNSESDEEEDDDLFDSICAICDNGGDLLCCDGPCMRSFHAKEGTGEDSYCDTLGYTEAEVEAMKIFLCKNCKYKQHQCYICGDLEPSDGPAAKVFLCNNATCGHFYHPKCVAKLLHPQNEKEASELEKQIAGGCSFTCPIHWCVRCKGLEDRTQEPLQFAVCRRCPKSYHRKCLPRKISFDDNEDEDIITRAWELSKRILIYCLDHKIDPNIDTPARNHIKFPEDRKPAGFLKNKTKLLVKKKRTHDELFCGQPSKEPAKMKDKVHVQERKQMFRKVSVKASSENLVDEPEEERTRFLKQKIQREPHMVKDASLSIPKPVEEHQQEQEMAPLPSSARRKIPMSSFPIVDIETEKRIITWLGNHVSSLTTKDVTKNCRVPSTHVYSGSQTERIIAQGKLERSVQAVEAAFKKLENGGNVDDAKAVCEPDVLKQLARWHSKIRVYISPFIHGMRYSSFGRHFTKEEKLVEIVDKLHWYVEPGDMIVDFCCGANDFSRLMKEKLDQVQKRCHFKNYDLIQPKNHFCFEKRDWMTVKPSELPHGSQLIMGLNPPFGVKASLANKFIDKALSFKPKLVVLIVPKETKRLDEKKTTPYDLIWEDSNCLAGKAFYLPGSVDHSDKTVEGWNASAPPLYLWSHPDWTMKHKKIAEEHNHSCIGNAVCHVGETNLYDLVKEEAQSKTGKTTCNPRENNLPDDLPVRKEPDVPDKRNSRSGKERDAYNVGDANFATDRWTKKRARSEDEKGKTERIANLSYDLPVRKEPKLDEKRTSRSGKERDACNVGDANLPADCSTKKRARSVDEKGIAERIAVHVKEPDVSDKVHGKKLAEATNKEVPPPGNRKEHDWYEIRSRKAVPGLIDSLPPEKQVEVTYEETKVRSKKATCDELKDCACEDGKDAYREESKSGQRNYEQRAAGFSDIKFKEGEDSDMSISPRDGRNDRNKSSNYSSSYIPAECISDRAAHRPMLSGAAYQGSYFESNYEHTSAYGGIDGSTRKNVSCFEELGYASAPTVGPHSLQSRRPDDNFYMQKISEDWNPSASERCLDSDMPMRGYLARYGEQLGASDLQVSRTPVINDPLSHPVPDGRSTDYYIPLGYSLGSSGARSSQPSITPSFGLSSAGAPRGSIMDRYAYGLSGPSGPQSSVMDRYAPSLDGTNKRFPQQYPFGRPDAFGGGRPHM